VGRKVTPLQPRQYNATYNAKHWKFIQFDQFCELGLVHQIQHLADSLHNKFLLLA